MKPFLLAAVLLLSRGRFAFAQLLSVSGNPATMTVSAVTAGSQPVAVSDNSTTYSALTVVLFPKKITAQLSSNMPTGTTLTITLAPTTGATSVGAVALDNVARDVLTNMTNAILETKAITYQFSATAAAGVITTRTRTVTLTLTAYP